MSLYSDHFGLRESPFSIAPNPEYLYMSDRHRGACSSYVWDSGRRRVYSSVWRGWHGKNNCLPLPFGADAQQG